MLNEYHADLWKSSNRGEKPVHEAALQGQIGKPNFNQPVLVDFRLITKLIWAQCTGTKFNMN